MKKLTALLLFTSILISCNANDASSTSNDSNAKPTQTNDCDPKWKVEGINDAKGEYSIGNDKWTIHFEEDNFIAFNTSNGTQLTTYIVQEIVAQSNCEYKVMMVDVQGEMVPTWTLVYNAAENFYDLHVHDYDAETDTWTDRVFAGSSDNG